MTLDYKKYDSQNMFSNIYNFAQQLHDAMEIGKDLKLRPYSNIKNIVFAGMGGSAIAGDIITTLASKSSIPLVVSRTYSVPSWVNEQTLVICLSYSGNTQETLSSFHDAYRKKARIIGITSGGTLAEELQQKGFDTITIPGGLPPRAALGYLTVPILYFLNSIQIIHSEVLAQLPQTIELLKIHRSVWSKDNEHNEAYIIAQHIYQTIPIICGEPENTSAIARRWCNQLAENSKMLGAFYDVPEFNHNEIVGFDKNSELLKKCSLIWLTDLQVHANIRTQIEITQSILEPLISYQKSLTGQGNSLIERMFYLIHLGDWVSFWCAILHQEDPTPVQRISLLKKLLSQ